MKRKNVLRKFADNEYTLLTGQLAFTVYDKTKDDLCLIARYLSHDNMPVQRSAFYLYTGIKEKNRYIEVFSTCNIQNCVKSSHLFARYKPNAKDADYIKTYLKIDGAEALAHRHNVPIDMFNDYLRSVSLI